MALSFGLERAADAIVTIEIEGGDFQSGHEALVEAIEAEGTVVGAPSCLSGTSWNAPPGGAGGEAGKTALVMPGPVNQRW